ncbi:MAG: fluoride efflux transporter CrcB [Desulfobacterales bacterium]|nr:fluoride efflux transporter CrcB [Desulfobacterales bacterium]
MIKILLVLIGGGIGAVCRYSVSLLSVKLLGVRFPWGTLFVNLTGCFLIGICFALSERVTWLNPSVRLFFMTGFLGGLTTFSTFALETVIAERKGSDPISLINFFANNVIGMIMVLAGIWIVQLMFKER